MKKLRLENILNSEFKIKKLSINKVSKDCKIPKSVLHGWLNGVIPSAKNLYHIKTLCEYLGLSIEQILFGEINKIKECSNLFETTFNDGNSQYKLIILKLNKINPTGQ